eukprot:Skav206006  [mRNA]  locus=scaffold2084:566483:570273:- [translate_table: standard]
MQITPTGPKVQVVAAKSELSPWPPAVAKVLLLKRWIGVGFAPLSRCGHGLVYSGEDLPRDTMYLGQAVLKLPAAVRRLDGSGVCDEKHPGPAPDLIRIAEMDEASSNTGCIRLTATLDLRAQATEGPRRLAVCLRLIQPDGEVSKASPVQHSPQAWIVKCK